MNELNNLEFGIEITILMFHEFNELEILEFWKCIRELLCENTFKYKK